MTDSLRRKFSTRQIHEGTDIASATPRALPIHLTAGFTFDSFEQGAAHFSGGEGFGYTRIGNPTIDAVERKLAALENGTKALLLASGQAAVSTAILGLAGAGDHVVSSNHIYEGSRGLFIDLLARFGVSVTFIDDIADPEAWRGAIQDNTRVLFAESIANASNLVIDIAEVAAVGREHGVPLVIDNTFATPALIRPLEHGAALSIHSASKFLAGQGSVIGGVIVDGGTFDRDVHGARFAHFVEADRCGGPSFADKYGVDTFIGYVRESVAPRLGPTISPLNAFLIGQGTETLNLRVREQSRSAQILAEYLAAHPAVESVDYLGLPSHPDYHRADSFVGASRGSVFQFTLRGGRAAAEEFINGVSVLTHMTHLGDVRTLVLHPASTSHVFRTAEERAAVGVFEGTLRLSIGLEDVSDLLAEFERLLG